MILSLGLNFFLVTSLTASEMTGSHLTFIWTLIFVFMFCLCSLTADVTGTVAAFQLLEGTISLCNLCVSKMGEREADNNEGLLREERIV